MHINRFSRKKRFNIFFYFLQPLVPTLLAAAAASSSPNTTTIPNSTITNNNGTAPTSTNVNHPHLVHPSSYVTSSSSTDSSSGQHHPYAYTNMATSTNKISSTTTNLVVDSTSHLPEIINVPSSPSIIETATTTINSNIQQISANELINNENVCLKKSVFFILLKDNLLRLNQILHHLIHHNQQVQ